jgi:ABC-type Zn uptake system ZnuABC Zn-binding protein ZnuA
MIEAVEQMLVKYNPQSSEDYENALKEILQEIILLGLDRNGFFEKAALKPLIGIRQSEMFLGF